MMGGMPQDDEKFDMKERHDLHITCLWLASAYDIPLTSYDLYKTCLCMTSLQFAHNLNTPPHGKHMNK